jgi:hypothetical protein
MGNLQTDIQTIGHYAASGEPYVRKRRQQNKLQIHFESLKTWLTLDDAQKLYFI